MGHHMSRILRMRIIIVVVVQRVEVQVDVDQIVDPVVVLVEIVHRRRLLRLRLLLLGIIACGETCKCVCVFIGKNID